MAAIASAELIAEPKWTVRIRPERTTQALRVATNLLAATTDRPAAADAPPGEVG